MVVNDFNRTASLDHEKGKKGATAGKEFRKEEARRFFPFFDTKIGRPSRIERNATYCTNSTCRVYVAHALTCRERETVDLLRAGEAKSRFRSARFNAYPLQHVVRSMWIDEDG